MSFHLVPRPLTLDYSERSKCRFQILNVLYLENGAMYAYSLYVTPWMALKDKSEIFRFSMHCISTMVQNYNELQLGSFI